MSPKILQVGALIFWFHSYDALYEDRASIHVGRGLQDDENDAKVWLEPTVEIAKPGRSLKRRELLRALKIIQQHQEHLQEKWHGYKRKTR